MAIPDPIHPTMSGVHNPIFIWHVPEAPSEELIETWAVETIAWLRDIREPFSWIGDMRAFKRSTPRNRARVVQFGRQAIPIFAEYGRSHAVVTESAWTRGVMSAFLWFVKPPCPHGSFATLSEALYWSGQQLGIDAQGPDSSRTG